MQKDSYNFAVQWRESFYGAAERLCYECLSGRVYPVRRSFFVPTFYDEVFVWLSRF